MESVSQVLDDRVFRLFTNQWNAKKAERKANKSKKRSEVQEEENEEEEAPTVLAACQRVLDQIKDFRVSS